jgi:hypothetical protein
MTAGRCVHHAVRPGGVRCRWKAKEGLVVAVPGQLTSFDPSQMNVPLPQTDRSEAK